MEAEIRTDLLRLLKMSVCGDEEERAESSASGWMQAKSDRSMILPPHLGNDPGPAGQRSD